MGHPVQGSRRKSIGGIRHGVSEGGFWPIYRDEDDSLPVSCRQSVGSGKTGRLLPRAKVESGMGSTSRVRGNRSENQNGKELSDD